MNAQQVPSLEEPQSKPKRQKYDASSKDTIIVGTNTPQNDLDVCIWTEDVPHFLKVMDTLCKKPEEPDDYGSVTNTPSGHMRPRAVWEFCSGPVGLNRTKLRHIQGRWVADTITLPQDDKFNLRMRKVSDPAPIDNEKVWLGPTIICSIVRACRVQVAGIPCMVFDVGIMLVYVVVSMESIKYLPQ